MRLRRGFTLIELLVVIAIIAILAAILFPVFAKARERGKMAACLSNSKQIGLILRQYADDYDEGLPFNPYTTSLPHTRPWVHLFMAYAKSADIFRCPSHAGTPVKAWKIDSEHFFTTGYPANNGAIPANPDVNTWYTREVPAIGYAFNEVQIGGYLDNKRHTLKQLKDPASIAMFGDGIYWYSGANAPSVLPSGDPPGTKYWDWGEPGVSDWWGRPQHLGGCEFVYADGHAGWAKPVKLTNSGYFYGYYPKARLN
ncbi:MAG TPA: prepilin-type N-terminal cleavage/methylation domain-containing protein [Armatimonadota bacterium]|jgi:prepilin-type N-terminal cleavage/methylation domain-containing protein